MLLFTKKQLEQIREYLAAYGIRTTDFPDAPTITADDWVAIVQGGVNKKVKISDLFDPDLLPSLIVDINVKDDWAEITDADHDTALSARLGKELHDAISDIEPTTVLSNWSQIYPTSTTQALSASLGLDLLNRINDSLTVIDNLTTPDHNSALSAYQGTELYRMVKDRPTIEITELTDSERDTVYKHFVYTWLREPSSQQIIDIYTKGQIDELFDNYSPSPVGSLSLDDLTDVDIDTSTVSSGMALVYNGEEWVAGVVSGQDTWRPLYKDSVTNQIPDSDSLIIAGGTGISLSTSRDSTNGRTTLTISATGGATGGGDYYIGNTKAHPDSEDPYNLLEGLGSIEILGMTDGTGDRKIYFGNASTPGTPYIELITPVSGSPYFHFSHGLYSDSFISAAGLNPDSSSGPSGVSYLYALSDVYGDTSENKVKRLDNTDYTYAQVGDALVLGANGKWGAAPVSGGQGPSTQIQSDWAQTNTASVDYIKNKPTLFSGSYNDLTNKPVIDSALSSSSTNAVQNKVINSALNGKQGTISDLETIRSGAAAGATALQASNIKKLQFGETSATHSEYNPIGSDTPRVMGISDLTNVIGYNNGAYIQIGQIKLQYVNESSKEYLKVVKADGTAANLYATGSVTAGSTS